MATNITKLREQIATLQAERTGIETAGRSREEFAASLAAFCRFAASEGEARMAYHVQAENFTEAFLVRERAPDGSPNLAPMLGAVLGAEGLCAALSKHVDKVPVGLSAAERAARVVAIGAELDKLEREEEAQIVRSEATGSPIARRGDARPEIVLEVVR